MLIPDSQCESKDVDNNKHNAGMSRVTRRPIELDTLERHSARICFYSYTCLKVPDI